MPRLMLIGEYHNSPNRRKIGSVVNPEFNKKKSVLLVEFRGPKSVFETNGPSYDAFFATYRRIACLIDKEMEKTVPDYLSVRELPFANAFGLEPLLTMDLTYFVASRLGAPTTPSIDIFASMWKYYKIAEQQGTSTAESNFVRGMYFYYHPLLSSCLISLPVAERFVIQMLSEREVEQVPCTEMPQPSVHDFAAMSFVRSQLQARSILHFLREGKDVYAICGASHVPLVAAFVRQSADPQMEVFFTESAVRIFNDVPLTAEMRGVKINFMG